MAKTKKPVRSPKKPAKKPVGRSAKVEMTIDRALKRRWDAALTAMHAAKAHESSGFDAYWEAVGAVIDHDPPLYLAGGSATIGEFLAGHVGESERTARRNIRVARFASAQEETRYTVTKLDATLAWLEARGLALEHGKAPIDFAALRFDVERDGKARRLSLAEVTTDEILALTTALRRDQGRSRKGSTPEIDAVAKGLRADRSLRGVSVGFRDGAFSFRAVPAVALVAFARALLKAKVPTA